jgi:hypothetical protein
MKSADRQIARGTEQMRIKKVVDYIIEETHVGLNLKEPKIPN